VARLALLVILALAGLPATASATHPGGNELLAADAEVLGTNTSTIYVGKRDGSGLRALPSPCPPGPLDFLERCYAATPAWSPDGRTIAFTVLRQAREEIWLVEADGSGLRQVPGAFGTSPSWSPDGTCSPSRSIPRSASAGAGGSTRSGSTGAGYGGSRAGRPTTRTGRPAEIAFSRLGYFDAGDGSCWTAAAVAAVRPGEAGVRTIARRGAGNPSWAPGGRALAFQRSSGLYRARADGSAQRLLLSRERTRYFEGPAWSPNGRLIAFRDLRRTRAIRARDGRPVSVRFDPPGTAYSPA
jgi:hypothetical protein